MRGNVLLSPCSLSSGAAGGQRDGCISKQARLVSGPVLFVTLDRLTRQGLPGQLLRKLRSDLEDNAPQESRRASKVRDEEQGAWCVICRDQQKACAGKALRDRLRRPREEESGFVLHTCIYQSKGPTELGFRFQL